MGYEDVHVRKQLPTFRASLFAPYWRSDSVFKAYAVAFLTLYPEDAGSQLLRNACNITNRRQVRYQKTCSFFMFRSLSLKIVAQKKNVKYHKITEFIYRILFVTKAVCIGDSVFPRHQT